MGQISLEDTMLHMLCKGYKKTTETSVFEYALGPWELLGVVTGGIFLKIVVMWLLVYLNGN